MVTAEINKKDLFFRATMADEIIAGHAVHLVITLQNRGRENVSYRHTSKYEEVDLVLIDSAGKPVPLTRFGKICYGGARQIGSAVKANLGVGKTIEMTLNLARLFDLTSEGQYFLTIGRQLNQYETREKLIELKLEKMSFKIIEER